MYPAKPETDWVSARRFWHRTWAVLVSAWFLMTLLIAGAAWPWISMKAERFCGWSVSAVVVNLIAVVVLSAIAALMLVAITTGTAIAVVIIAIVLSDPD